MKVNFTDKLRFYVLILPNIVTDVLKHIPYLSKNWSIGNIDIFLQGVFAKRK